MKKHGVLEIKCDLCEKISFVRLLKTKSDMAEFLSQYHLAGVLVGLAAFLIIGLFHPLVIKGEYYFGRKCRWWFLAAGIVLLAACIAVSDIFWSSLLGVASGASKRWMSRLNACVKAGSRPIRRGNRQFGNQMLV